VASCAARLFLAAPYWLGELVPHTNETFRVLFDFAERGDAVALAPPCELVIGDQHEDIAVAGLRLAEKRQSDRAAWVAVGLP